MINKTTFLTLMLGVSGAFGMTEAEFKALYERTDKDAEACYRLYEAYRDGDGVEKNAAKARKWLLGAHRLGKPVYNEIATQPWRKKASLKPGRKLTPKFSEETIREKGKEIYQILQGMHPATQSMYGEERMKLEEKMVRKLLTEGADPNYCQDERNLLCKALDQNHMKIAKMLIAAGADPEVQHRAAWVAAEMAANFEERVSPKEKIWRQNGDRRRVPLKEIVDFLIRSGADFTVHDTAGRAPLHTAVKSRSTKLVELFCKAGADPNMKGSIYEIAGPVDKKAYYYQLFRINDEEAPLFYAIHCADVELVNCLLQHGASPTMPNGKGITPLQMAEKHMKEEQTAPHGRPEYVQKYRRIMQVLHQAIRAAAPASNP